MVGADEPIGFFSGEKHSFLRRFLDNRGFAIFGRTYQYGFGDECFPFFGDGKGFINSGCILQNLSGQDGNGVAEPVGTADLAALIVTVRPVSFMPDNTPIIPGHPTEANLYPCSGT